MFSVAGWPVWGLIALFIVGLALIVKGGDFFVDAAGWIAEVSGIPRFIVGATIVSFATTLPELIVSCIGAARGTNALAIGNAVGSVTANLALIMGIALVCLPSAIRRRDYVQMARLYGGGTWYLIRTHIGHELWPLLTINALAVVGRAILQESSLAFLGLSDPLARSWGMMIARAVDFPGLYRTDFWTWWLLPPVGALVLSTLLLRLLVGGLEEQQRRDKPCCWK